MTFLDVEIAHIARAIALALKPSGSPGASVLPSAYWRERLHELMDFHHLAHGQLCAIDTLLDQLDRFDAQERWIDPRAHRRLI